MAGKADVAIITGNTNKRSKLYTLSMTHSAGCSRQTFLVKTLIFCCDIYGNAVNNLLNF